MFDQRPAKAVIAFLSSEDTAFDTNSARTDAAISRFERGIPHQHVSCAFGSIANPGYYYHYYYHYYLTGAAPPNRPPSPIPLTRCPLSRRPVKTLTRGWSCLGLLFVCPRRPPLPPVPVKFHVFALAPRSRCKNVGFYEGRRQRRLPGADKKKPKTAPTTGQRVDGSTGQRATGPRNRARWPVRGRSPC